MRDKNEKELQAEHQSRYIVIKCQSDFRFEKKFQRSFTNSMFKKVQAEIRRLMYCHVLPPNVEETTNVLPPGVEKFKVREKLIVFELKMEKDVLRPHTRILFDGAYPQMTNEYKQFKENEKSFVEFVDLSFDNNHKLSCETATIDIKEELLAFNVVHGGSDEVYDVAGNANKIPLPVHIVQRVIILMVRTQQFLIRSTLAFDLVMYSIYITRNDCKAKLIYCVDEILKSYKQCMPI
ncbi:hypothetical protein GH714_009940 [Hevea brasiliensis]|uniref:Uncharacterized protein n=1 Tax=Hevea brasiliensis TaxID=3981 RepID=A0A6A6LN83_HEVBR|nr:hypothetical protein GH714_009940 [Hevea brasiliensis]